MLIDGSLVGFVSGTVDGLICLASAGAGSFGFLRLYSKSLCLSDSSVRFNLRTKFKPKLKRIL